VIHDAKYHSTRGAVDSFCWKKYVENIYIKKAYYTINEFYDENSKITDDDVMNWNTKQTKKGLIKSLKQTINYLYITLNN
jgi:hypothetical protein